MTTQQNMPGDEFKMFETKTESLEAELKALSERLTDDRKRFDDVKDELERRHHADVRPPRLFNEFGEPAATAVPKTREQLLQLQLDVALGQNRVLMLKVTEMEAEQAKLVIEIEAAKFGEREAKERLALVAKYHQPKDS